MVRNRKFCSNGCMRAANLRRHKVGSKACAICAAQFTIAAYGGTQKYCSEPCRQAGHARVRQAYELRLDRKLNTIMRRCMWGALRRRGASKGGESWEQLAGYTVQELQAHLEALFVDGMTWDDVLSGRVHIDHIRPLASFRFASAEDDEFRTAWALSNLQPLWAEENIAKGSLFAGRRHTWRSPESPRP